MELPENKFMDFIKSREKIKWRPVNNHNIKKFTQDDIKRITNKYSALIGKGGFGQVYQGALDDGTPVAVKKYMHQNLKDGFGKEIMVHSQINHKNVVRLLGYCTEENALMIVTEYVSGGNLGDLLHGGDDSISLDDRLRIAIECADALGYMHSSMYQPVIHGDIKPDNILLDNKLSPKLSDFGLSRLLSMDETQYTMHVAGSRGYMDPEYMDTGLLDPKSDVYSFGVVLLELITRAKVSENGFSTQLKRNFADALRKGKQEARKMFDSEISNKENIDILDEIGNLAAECFTKEIKERPEMKDVEKRLQILRRALRHDQAQEKMVQGSPRRTKDTAKKVNRHGKSIFSSSSNSVVPYKLRVHDIFNGIALRKYFVRNGGEIHDLKVFTERELSKITHNYSVDIGRSSSGTVYMGWIDENKRVVVKKSTLVDEALTDYFINAARISHKNIIRLLGYCLETEVPRLVYELVSGGSLHNLLHGNDGRRPVSLGLRLDIAIGSTEALAYLHSAATTGTLIHGHFQSTKILLGECFVPKVSYIGSTGLGTVAQVSGDVRGNLAYVDPVYMLTGRFTPKSDVYSFGIVLLELITRKQSRYFDHVELHKSAYEYMLAMFDNEVTLEKINMDILQWMGVLAARCLKGDVDARPEMAEVLEELRRLKTIWNERRRNGRGDH